MNSLHNDFLKRSVAALEKLVERAKNEDVLSAEFVRDAFRTLHTIKGTSQTFGFSAASNLAHELEDLLSEAKGNDDFLTESFKANLLKEFGFLIDSFTQTADLKVRKSFLGKSLSAKNNDSTLPQDFAFASEIYKQFSEYEKKSFVSEVSKGRNIYLIQADFDLSNFTVEFKKLLESLSAKGEIIATLSNPTLAEQGKIGFRICLASDEQIESFRELSKNFSIETIHQKPVPENCLDKILSQIVTHGKDLAEKFEKEISFEVSTAKIQLSPEKANLIFDILLHLVRNAIDHAFRTKAERVSKAENQKSKIEISLKSAKNGLKLKVKDNGKGIDPEKIRAKAVEKRLILPDKTLTESEMLDLIFLHEFSTAETLTEISGRGIGLDAVKNLVENANGTISVKSKRNFGTTFEVFLRYE